ncbi:MAG: hypothetical protein ABIH49_02180 [archaeon]
MNEEINFIVPEKISLLNHPTLNEKWVQQKIADTPQVLDISGHNLILRDKERIQPRAGRLDLLFQCSDCDKRFEVEVQLGKVDESHIIRTIEYWDIERKRYPQYDHCAVIIAEDITNRFLNVINLLNGAIPLIVIKMEAYKHQNNSWLTFTTVLNEANLGLVEEDEIKEVTDRNYWEKMGPKTITLADEVIKMIKEFDSNYELKYNKFYIGLAKNGQPDNFVTFRLRKTMVVMDIKLEQLNETDKLIEDSGLDLMGYDSKWGRYNIRISGGDLEKNRELIMRLLKMASGRNIED